MKKFILISHLYLLTVSALSQKVHVQVIKSEKEVRAEWQVLDFQQQIIASSNDSFYNDSAIFSLEANTKYSLKISVSEILKSDTPLYLLLLENEPIILVNSDLGVGDHFYPFFTGTRTRETKIAGGVSTSITFFPWQIYYISGNFRCGGSIISPDWVVTAAHCTKDDLGNPIPVASMSVKVGSNNPGNSANLNNTVDGKRYFVSQVIVHEGYNLTYKWSQNGQVIQSGPSSQIAYSDVLPSNSGSYECEISGTCGTLYSIPVILTVHPLTKITFISPDVKVPFGNDITLAVRSEGYNLSYQWEKDGQFLDNRNDSTLLLQNLNATDIGLYQTIVTGECGTKTSDTIYVYVTKENSSLQTEVFVWPTITTASFNVATSNDTPYSIMIFNSMGKLVKEQTNCHFQTSVDISTMAQGIYIINVFNNSFKKSIKLFKE